MRVETHFTSNDHDYTARAWVVFERGRGFDVSEIEAVGPTGKARPISARFEGLAESALLSEVRS